jgi:CRISPR-associated protein Csx17
MVSALRKVDRNRGHRAYKPSIRFQQLPGAWAEYLLDDKSDDEFREERIGLALATLFPSKHNAKAKKERAAHFLPYWLGVQQREPYCTLPEAVPFRRVWGAGTLKANLAAVLHRRLIEEEPSAEPPFGAWYRVALGDIEAWLSGAVDDAEIERWAMRFSLFAWDRDSVAAVGRRLGSASQPDVQWGSLALFALFKPLFQRTLLHALLPDARLRKLSLKERPPDTLEKGKARREEKQKTAKVGPLPGIAAQLARGDVTAAVRLTRTAYRAAGIEPAKIVSERFDCSDPQRLLAGLLIPTHPSQLCEEVTLNRRKIPSLASRWFAPRKNNNT